jgi:hypothetical protein
MVVQQKRTNQKDQPKKPNHNDQVQINLSKMHFSQVGHGGKKTIWGVFFYKNSLSRKHEFHILIN